jgi:hypothetical protein
MPSPYLPSLGRVAPPAPVDLCGRKGPRSLKVGWLPVKLGGDSFPTDDRDCGSTGDTSEAGFLPVRGEP